MFDFGNFAVNLEKSEAKRTLGEGNENHLQQRNQLQTLPLFEFNEIGETQVKRALCSAVDVCIILFNQSDQ